MSSLIYSLTPKWQYTRSKIAQVGRVAVHNLLITFKKRSVHFPSDDTHKNHIYGLPFIIRERTWRDHYLQVRTCHDELHRLVHL